MVTSKVICNGKELRAHRLSIEQNINWHHRFEIAIEAESIEKRRALNIDKSIDFLGKALEVEIQTANKYSGNGLIFKGFVTSVHIDRSYAEDDLIILKGFSYTYMLEDGLGCQSFEEMTGDDIFKEITGNYPSNVLKPTASSNYSDTIPYMVRYKETSYQFLSRLAAMCGEWLYYNGQEFVYGRPQNTNNVELKLGTDLQNYEYGVTMKPSNFEWLSYNYIENEQLNKSSNDYEPNELDKYGKYALATAKNSFAGGYKIPTMFDIKKESQLNDTVEILKTSILSNTSTFKGQSKNPSLTIGTEAEIYGKGDVYINRFRIVAVHHTVNAHYEYNNHFEALPYENTIAPLNQNVIKPEAESEVAIVKENDDPEKLGRVRVQFNWQSGDDLTPWIRVGTAHASGDRGIYFTPEIGDEVMVDFEQANPDRPYVSNAFYHGKAKPEWADPDNNLKAIKTRSGHTILLDDTDGNEIISIADKNNNLIKFDTKEKTVYISSEKKMVLESEEIEIKASKNIHIDAEENIQIGAGENIQIGAEENIEIAASQDLNLLADASLTLQSTDDMTAKSRANLAMEATQDITAKGLNAIIEGKTSAELNGTQTKVTAKAMTEVSGKIVKIN